MTGMIPIAVKFTDLSLGDPVSWKWNFADGTTSTERNPVHTYTTAGAYDVVLEISRGEDMDSSTTVINAGGVPVTDFVADKTSVNTKEKIQFTDKTLNNPTSWKWDFGDGSDSAEQNPSKVYIVPGIHTVTLSTRNQNGGDTEIKKDYINDGMSPVADFFSDSNAYQRSNTYKMMRFVDISQNSPTSWSWNFGDGATSTEQNPKHIYSTDGTYTVSLTVKNKFGEDTKVVNNIFNLGQGPKVDFKADKTVVGVGRNIRFTDLSTNSPTSWLWDFGDGTTGHGQNPDHFYRATGVYDVSLMASNQYTSINQMKKQYITVVNIPRSDFVADKTKGQAPFEVLFTDLSKGNPVSWNWNFGDGITSTDRNPVHKYTTIGTYPVSLTTTNANGQDTETKEKYIVVTQGPIADFKVEQRIGKAPFIVKFKDLSTGNPMKWSWDFGDGTTSTEQNPQHTYAYEGNYDVRLTVSNQYGSDTSFKTGTTGEVIMPPTTAPTTAPVVMTTAVKETATTTKPITQAALATPVVISALAISALVLAGFRKD
jgi:PKD repeat protein